MTQLPADYPERVYAGVPLVVTDDDLTGTFTFLRILPNYGNTRDLTPVQIGSRG